MTLDGVKTVEVIDEFVMFGQTFLRTIRSKRIAYAQLILIAGIACIKYIGLNAVISLI